MIASNPVIQTTANSQFVDAGGDTANGTTRVAIIAFADEADVALRGTGAQGIALWFGNNGSITLSADGWNTQIDTVFDEEGVATDNRISMRKNAVRAKVALHVGTPFAAAVIGNIDEDHPLTRNLLNKALDKIKVKNPRLLIVGSRAALTSFEEQRYADGGYVDNGQAVALNHKGIPLKSSDWIVDTYPVVTV